MLALVGQSEDSNPRLPAAPSTGVLVADLMTRPQPVVPSHLSMGAARKIARLKAADSLIVEDKGCLVGILDSEILRSGSDEQRVGDCLKPLSSCLSPTTTLESARALLIQHGVGSLPVAAGPFLVGSLSRSAVERSLAAPKRLVSLASVAA
jgi:CBS domain-containing protein